MNPRLDQAGEINGRQHRRKKWRGAIRSCHILIRMGERRIWNQLFPSEVEFRSKLVQSAYMSGSCVVHACLHVKSSVRVSFEKGCVISVGEAGPWHSHRRGWLIHGSLGGMHGSARVQPQRQQSWERELPCSMLRKHHTEFHWNTESCKWESVCVCRRKSRAAFCLQNTFERFFALDKNSTLEI